MALAWLWYLIALEFSHCKPIKKVLESRDLILERCFHGLNQLQGLCLSDKRLFLNNFPEVEVYETLAYEYWQRHVALGKLYNTLSECNAVGNCEPELQKVWLASMRRQEEHHQILSSQADTIWPTYVGQDVASIASLLWRYAGMYPDNACSTARDIWYLPTLDDGNAKYYQIARKVGLSRGEVVLELGAGCGHKLATLRRRFGVITIALELSLLGARRLFDTGNVHAVCAGDSLRNLRALPDNFADVTIANAVIEHLPATMWCVHFEELVRISKRVVWLGWISVSLNVLSGCELSGVRTERFPELSHFGRTEYNSTDRETILF